MIRLRGQGTQHNTQGLSRALVHRGHAALLSLASGQSWIAGKRFFRTRTPLDPAGQPSTMSRLMDCLRLRCAHRWAPPDPLGEHAMRRIARPLRREHVSACGTCLTPGESCRAQHPSRPPCALHLLAPMSPLRRGKGGKRWCGAARQGPERAYKTPDRTVCVNTSRRTELGTHLSLHLSLSPNSTLRTQHLRQ